jgi:uncharacterized protein (TIGR02266 family)
VSTGSEYEGEERRGSQRASGALVVRMRFPRLEDFRYRYTRDISRGGVFIQTLKPKPAGSRVVIVLEPQGGAPVSIQGEVVTSLGPEEAAVRALQPGMGIRFLDLDADKRRAIEAIIEHWGAAVQAALDTSAPGAPDGVFAATAAPDAPDPAVPAFAAIPAVQTPRAPEEHEARAAPPAPRPPPPPKSVGARTAHPPPPPPPEPPRPAPMAAAPAPSDAPVAPRGTDGELGQIAAEARALLAKMEGASHYTMLGIAPDASSAEIRRAFLRLTKRFHPDNYFRRASKELAVDLEDIYNQLTQCYETLIDRDKRMSYDIANGHLAGNKDGMTSDDMSRAAAEDRRRKNAPGRTTKADQLIALANQQVAAGQPAKALANLRLALAFDPDSATIQAKIAELKGKRT